MLPRGIMVIIFFFKCIVIQLQLSAFSHHPLRFYLFIFRERGREREREGEKHQCVVASHTPPPTGDTAHNPAGNQTSPPWVHRPALNPLSYTSQGLWWSFCNINKYESLCCTPQTNIILYVNYISIFKMMIHSLQLVILKHFMLIGWQNKLQKLCKKYYIMLNIYVKMLTFVHRKSWKD